MKCSFHRVEATVRGLFEMQREAFFSRQGSYRFIVDCNVLLHREAGGAARSVLSTRIGRWSRNRPIRVLDLACGGQPISVSALMAAFPAEFRTLFERQAFSVSALRCEPSPEPMARYIAMTVAMPGSTQPWRAGPAGSIRPRSRRPGSPRPPWRRPSS